MNKSAPGQENCLVCFSLRKKGRSFENIVENTTCVPITAVEPPTVCRGIGEKRISTTFCSALSPPLCLYLSHGPCYVCVSPLHLHLHTPLTARLSPSLPPSLPASLSCFVLNFFVIPEIYRARKGLQEHIYSCIYSFFQLRTAAPAKRGGTRRL